MSVQTATPHRARRPERVCPNCGGRLERDRQYCSVQCVAAHRAVVARATQKARALELVRDFGGLPLTARDVRDELDARVGYRSTQVILEELVTEGFLVAGWFEGERNYRAVVS